MSKPAADCRQIVERLTGDFNQLSAKLNEIITDAAETSRTVGQILDAQERKAKSLFQDAATPDRDPARAVPRPEVPQVGDDGPLMLSGRRALDELVARYGDNIVFHGSAAPISRLEPRQMTWVDRTGRRHPDGEPAICADTSYDVPMFLSLFKGRVRCQYRPTEDGGFTYNIKGADTADLGGYTGHVHVMDKRHFQEVELDYPPEWPGPFGAPRTPELRASTEVEPFAIVDVTGADFPHPVGDYDV
ncbi:hypothetical protein [Nocardia carnea]|uniref:hypothetical protein n=1 Tax=Nocardia carnea TaxID=37328 RepID=UPI002456E82A|nr:hypothetical protein [Nocardia carnea]